MTGGMSALETPSLKNKTPVRERRYPNLTGVFPLKPLSQGAKLGKQPSRNATLLSWYGGIRSAE